MEGVISNYRRGRHTVHPKQCILAFPNITNKKDANKLIGHKVVWKTPTGKEIKGKINRAHGNNGAVRALFKKAGIPGQALGQKIKIIK
ncbi:MAG: 50S ribosomal protein L35ae [Candidatus Lokiarchaeota archaeon]|nr:50S ribosomal protein L35ae [Candidatus Lokiarchaeota archaeon]